MIPLVHGGEALRRALERAQENIAKGEWPLNPLTHRDEEPEGEGSGGGPDSGSMES